MSFWDKLVEASPDIVATDERREARLFSALLLLFSLCAAASLFILIAFAPPNNPFYREPIFIMVFLGNFLYWFLYAISRTRFYRYALFLFLVATQLFILAAVAIDSEHPDTIYWLIVPIFLGGMLLPFRLGLMVGVLNLISVLLLPLFVAQFTVEYASFSAFTMFTVSLLVSMFARLRREDLSVLRQERAYLAYLSETLQKITDELELRITERTHDLAEMNQTLRDQIVEQEQTETLLAQRNRELSVLNRVLATVTAGLSMEEVLTVACQELAQILDATHCSAALFSPDYSSVTIIAEALPENEPTLVGQKLAAADAPIMRRIKELHQPLVFEDVREYVGASSSGQLIASRGIVSLLVLPLYIQGKAAGSLGLGRMTRRAFSQQEIALGSNIAAAVSQSLYAAHLFSAEREQRTLAEALLDTARLLGSTINLNELLDHVLDNVERVVPHDSANIMMLEDGYCRVVRSRGFPKEREEWINQAGFHVSSLPTLSWMRDTHQACWIPDTHQSDLWHRVEDTEHILSYIGAPMFVEGELIGFIHADSFSLNKFNALHAEHLQAFANQVALTIQNTRLHERLAQYAELLEQKVVERTAALAQVNEELRALAQLKDDFVANISHELRTPITNLMLRQTLLEKMPEKQTKHLDVMRRETQRLNRIIEDLLQLSRLDRGRIELVIAPLDLNELVAQYAADRLPLAESLSLQLGLGQRLDIPLIQADEEMIGQVLSVLLTNALNYTPTGGRIEVCTHQQQVEGHIWVGFSVSDTGPGIAPEERAHLFERFFRGSAAHESGVSGTGLGLALAHEIITRHGGRIEVQSPVQNAQGAMFTVWFPLVEPLFLEEEE